MCSTCTPAARSAAAAPDTAALIARAPCEPPVTSSTGPSGRRPNRCRAAPRSAGRSSPVIAGRSGIPMAVAWGSRTPGVAVNTCVVIRAASRLATPGRALASWTTIGRPRPRAARRLQQGAVQRARQRRRRDELEGVAAGRDERGVQSADGAQGGDLRRGLQPAQRVGEVHRGLDVPGRMASGDNDARCRHACPRLCDGKIKIGVRVRFVFQRVMPPLVIV